MNKLILVLIGLLNPAIQLFAQETFPSNDIKDWRNESYAFTNATIVQDSKSILEGATMLIKKGEIIAIGNDIQLPKEVATFDLSDKFIYPSFVDMHTNYGLPAPDPPVAFNFMQQETIAPTHKGPYNANEAIRSAYNAIDHFKINADDAKVMRELGFGAVLTFMPDGLARGSSALVNLYDDHVNEAIINNHVAAHFSFKKGSSKQIYPISIMGSNALLRQTHYDALWYSNQPSKPFFDESLEAYIKTEQLPQIFAVTNLLNLFRADKMGDELGKHYIIKGSGHEYQRIEKVKSLNTPLIIPINFPAPPDVNDPFEALDVSLEKMKHWELAPYNLSFLERHGIDFAISTSDLEDKTKFWTNIRKAIKFGLSEETALKALTETPARLIRASDKVGQLKPGLLANFIICSNSLFSDSVKIHENWVRGKRFILSPIDTSDYTGTYELSLNDTTYQMVVGGTTGIPEFKIIKSDTVEIKVSAKIENSFINLNFSPKAEGLAIRLSGWIDQKNMKGSGQLADGTWIKWTATYTGPAKEKKEEDNKTVEEKESPEVEKPGQVIFPFIAYGDTILPIQEDLLIKNTTVWSNESGGILKNTDVLILKGKIIQLGTNLNSSNTRIIDKTGRHLTPGIIDEHTHLAISNGNEIAANSAMVRMEDALKPYDINIYRALSGGVTTVQCLHGSANPIGGQSAIIKLRWGQTSENMLIDGADKYIKFALGENVKRSRSPLSIRYPQTRMGVEQIYLDGFTRAKEYGEKWDQYNALSPSQKAKTYPPRKELDLEPLLEILKRERFITCHSYVQSEINMLMKVAEKFDFKVNTFTHILEGYKVADKMKLHGAGASSFSDWYNYKFEVIDAIPYNAAMLRSQGIVTAINSDDAEMGRRLNQEAAKSIKYGGMQEEDALKMVTLYPAQLLHLDHRMGSIKVGKDADVVLWSDHPLSIYAKAEKTIIDGTVYFDREKDLMKQQWIEKERARLIQKIKKANENGEKSINTPPSINHSWHCDDLFIEH